MDETVVNGAQLFFPVQFGISTDAAIAGSESKAQTNQWILGLVTGAPYVRPRFFLLLSYLLLLTDVYMWLYSSAAVFLDVG